MSAPPKDPRFCYLGFSFVFCWTSPTATVSISAVAVQPALFFRQNGQQRTTPELLGSEVVFCPDPYLTHTAAPWVWVKLWSGYHRIPALGMFLITAAGQAPRPFSWLPPAGRWWRTFVHRTLRQAHRESGYAAGLEAIQNQAARAFHRCSIFP